MQTSDISALDDYIHRCGKLSVRSTGSPTSLQNFAVVDSYAATATVRVLDTHTHTRTQASLVHIVLAVQWC